MKRELAIQDQEQALARYLDALFTPVVSPVAEPKPRLTEVAVDLNGPLVIVQTPTTSDAVASAVMDSSSVPTGVAAEQGPARSSSAAMVGIGPGFRAEVLIVRHRGLRLALPMPALEAVLPAPDDYPRLPGQATWMRGVFQHRGRNVPVVSIDVLSPGCDWPETSAVTPPQILILGDGRWALHVEEVIGTRALAPGDYRLRAERQRLPWLAGYVTDGLLSLIEGEALAAFLDALVEEGEAGQTAAGASVGGAPVTHARSKAIHGMDTA